MGTVLQCDLAAYRVELSPGFQPSSIFFDGGLYAFRMYLHISCSEQVEEESARTIAILLE